MHGGTSTGTQGTTCLIKDHWLDSFFVASPVVVFDRNRASHEIAIARCSPLVIALYKLPTISLIQQLLNPFGTCVLEQINLHTLITNVKQRKEKKKKYQKQKDFCIKDLRIKYPCFNSIYKFNERTVTRN